MNRVLQHLGSKYPIVQAPMGWISRSKLAAAVCNAGGFGVIETSSGETEICKQEIEAMKGLTDKPFGVNLPVLHLKDPSMIDFVANCGVKFVTTSAGNPQKFIGPLKEAGITVYHAVPNVAGALKSVDAGVDGLVVEGTEGGGFKNPNEVALIVLLQAIRREVDVPMIAAGGIADGRGMAAAFAAGAEGVQMGTRFVACAESPVHDNYKNSILAADETSTLMLNKNSSPCIRVLRTERTEKIYADGVMPKDTFAKIQDLYFGGDMEASVGLAGQSSTLINKVIPAAEVIEGMVSEFFEAADNLGKIAAARAF
ncbi:MAG: nitronate monooxygenase [Rhodospirillales bacterium]|nr:nitronate monooxygenase [Rhodospirillales bacterium]